MKRYQGLCSKVVSVIFGRLKLLLVVLPVLFSQVGLAESADINALTNAVAGKHRDPLNVARDRYRRPVETLAFFDVGADSTVVEIWPGKGWYSEILAPYLAARGRFYAAHLPANSEIDFFRRARAGYVNLLNDKPELFSATVLTEFYPPASLYAGPPGEVDFVLTFRNVHNWMKGGYDQAAFIQFFNLLKPGGVLGVVEHRAHSGTPEEVMVASGYVTEERVIQLAEGAGFILEGSSEINANPVDTKNHPKGVWSLPPTLRLGEANREYFQSIGESDRMTLKFRKPE